MKVLCAHDSIAPISQLIAHPKNRNKHPKDQVERLAKILEYQGWRYPVKVSNQTGFVTSGHGRIEAAKLNGWDSVPVNYQDYDSIEQEYADLQADNAIASWAELDLSGINADLGEIGPDLNIDLLGLRNFFVDAFEKFDANAAWDGMPEFSHQDLTSAFRVVVHFATEMHLKEFSILIGQELTQKTRAIWHPKAERQVLKDKRYSAE